MACCVGTERTADSKAIDAELKHQQAQEKTSLRVLILGTSASGKSTLCKQMRIIHSKGPTCFTQHELDNYKQILILNIFNGMKELVIQAELMNIKVMRKNKKVAGYFTEVNPYTEKLDAETVAKAKQLWADKGPYPSILSSLANLVPFIDCLDALYEIGLRKPPALYLWGLLVQ
jgi:guanine nucleotide-binding protein G(z) subunit alpha